ncbi:hypothetical protein DY000_02017258 [Brassica cretica]|uniref:Uncharacterized protein n=1 Tax=Brassica cretica TaxID=69181 RepID=A0ABQ7CR57_BRACR|nr:hypothetical protein DY000_02017258 [Brassica cretica]
MRLRRDSKLEPGTFRDPVLVLVSNYATTVSMVLYSLRGVFWDPSCASFRCDESKSFLAPSPDQSTQDIDVGFWDLTSRYQDEDLEGIKGVPDIGDGFRARIAGPCVPRVGTVVLEPRGGSSSSLQVIASSNGTTKPPPASPIEDRGTAIPIEDRDRAISERLRLCGVTSRKDHSARGTVGAGVDWTSFAKDSFSRYINGCKASGQRLEDTSFEWKLWVTELCFVTWNVYSQPVVTLPDLAEEGRSGISCLIVARLTDRCLKRFGGVTDCLSMGVQGRNRWWSSRYAAGSMELRYALMSMECPCRPLVGEGLLGVKYSLGGFRIRELWSWMFSLIDGRFLLIDGHVPLFFRQEKSLGLEDGARSQTRGQGTVTPEPGGRDLGPRGRNPDPGGRDLKDGSWSNRFMEYFSLTGSYADTPFTDNIALIEMPRKFSFPNINMYDGAGDPDNHIARYKQSMLAVALPREFREATMCKGFGSTLIGPALQWYINLPIGSISSFATLSNGFVEQFASSRNLEKTSDSLYEIL